MPKYLFFGIEPEKVAEYAEILKDIENVSVEQIYLDDLVKKYNFNILVSPANSFGVMTGGIDRDIVKMYPDCQKKVTNLIKKSKYSDKGGRNHIPVGCCDVVEMDCGKFLAIAPTMFLPQNIKGTNNVYLAFKSVYKKFQSLTDDILIACPLLGTGVGGMSGKESAKQILYVFNHK